MEQSNHNSFTSQKNLRAGGYTLSVLTALFILLFFLQFSLPQIPPIPQELGIEVNLGNSETGEGEEVPMAPGDYAATDTEQATPPPSTESNQEETTSDLDDPDGETIATGTKKQPTTITKEAVVNKNKTPNNSTATPAVPQPKAVFSKPGGTGTGGNQSDSYNETRNQGIAGGKGDQGKPNGNPNSDSYTGNAASGNSGVSIKSGLDGRRITKLPSFEDDFNENARVAIDITVDKNGNVINAVVNPRGTTTTNANIRNIAIRKAKTLKLNPSAAEEQTGTLMFNFRLRE